MKSAPAGSRPPPLIIDHPPAKRARVSPLGAARHPRGQLPCVDPLGSASRPAAGVVTPPRGGLAVPAAKTGRWTKREDETLRAVVEADAARLPLSTGAYDVVVDTFGLCVYDEPVAELRELGRVEKATGRILL